MKRRGGGRLTGALAALGLIITTMIWGTGFVVVKNSLQTIPPIYMLAFRFTLASAALLCIFAGRLRRITRASLLRSAVLGAALFTAYAFQTVGCLYTTAGKNALLTTVYVVLVPLMGWALYRKRPPARIFGAALTALGGIALLSLEGDFTVNIGDALTLICGIFYSAHIIFIERFTKNEDPPLLTALQLAWAALLAWGAAPLYDGAFPRAAFASLGSFAPMLYLGLIGTMVTFLLQNVCQKHVPAAAAALLLSLESLFGALAAAVFLGERMTGRMYAGGAVLFGAVALAQAPRERDTLI